MHAREGILRITTKENIILITSVILLWNVSSKRQKIHFDKRLVGFICGEIH
jgi:hypothetical protein